MIWSRSNEYYKTSWRGNYKTDGGVLTNQAIHLLDMLIYNFGEVASFDALAGFNKKKLQAEDMIIINFLNIKMVFYLISKPLLEQIMIIGLQLILLVQKVELLSKV